MAEKKDFQSQLNQFINDTSKAFQQIGDTLKNEAVKGKQLFESKLLERELNQKFKDFGRRVFQLYSAGKVELPPSEEPAIKEMVALIEKIGAAKQREGDAPEAKEGKPGEGEQAAKEEPSQSE